MLTELGIHVEFQNCQTIANDLSISYIIETQYNPVDRNSPLPF